MVGDGCFETRARVVASGNTSYYIRTSNNVFRKVPRQMQARPPSLLTRRVRHHSRRRISVIQSTRLLSAYLRSYDRPNAAANDGRQSFQETSTCNALTMPGSSRPSSLYRFLVTRGPPLLLRPRKTPRALVPSGREQT